MVRFIVLAALFTSFGAYSSNGYEVAGGKINEGNVSNIRVDFEECKVYQNSQDLGGSTIHCNKRNELILAFGDSNCKTLSHYRKLENGKTALTSFRFECEHFIKQGFNSSSMFVF